MRLVKEPDSEGVSTMSAIVYKAIQKSNAQVREETRRETRKETRKQDRLDFITNLLGMGVSMDFITQATGLTEDEIQDLLAQVTK